MRITDIRITRPNARLTRRVYGKIDGTEFLAVEWTDFKRPSWRVVSWERLDRDPSQGERIAISKAINGKLRAAEGAFR